MSLDMLFYLLVLSIAFVNTVHALPVYLRPSIWRRSSNSDMKTVKDHMSTEAVIGIIGLVVAIMGIVSSLAWSRVRRRSRGRSRPSLSLSTAEGMLSCYHALDTSRKLTRNPRADLPLSNRPSHAYPFASSQPILAWPRPASGDDRSPQHQQYYYVQYERIMVHGAVR